MSRTRGYLRRCEFVVRNRLPHRLRDVLRYPKFLATERRGSADIPPELMPNCLLRPTRHALVADLPKSGRIAEIGTQTGVFAHHILDVSDPAELHLVDLDLSLVPEALRADPRVRMHQGLSREHIAAFDDESFDWIYIDADHSYQGVLRDAEAARRKIRPGGYIVFNDFAHIDPFLGVYGVHRAAVEFIVTHRWEVALMAYDPHGLYDLAVRRPR